MLRKLLATSVLCLGSTAVWAEEAPSLAPASIDNWNGFHAGIMAGTVSSDSKVTGVTPDSEGFSGPDGTPRQSSAGGYFGYDHMVNDMLVVGVVADANARFGSDDDGTTDGPAIPSDWNTSSDWNASIRGRVGLATQQALFYATAGVAFADYELDNPCGGCADWGTDNILGGTRTGWVAGAGVEFKLSDSWRVKAEYLHADYGSHEYANGDLVTESDITSDALQVGLAYHFN